MDQRRVLRSVPEVIDYIKDDQTVWENDPLGRLAAEAQLQGFLHEGFWNPMDTMRDRRQLEEIWSGGKAPWRGWDDA